MARWSRLTLSLLFLWPRGEGEDVGGRGCDGGETEGEVAVQYWDSRCWSCQATGRKFEGNGNNVGTSPVDLHRKGGC